MGALRRGDTTHRLDYTTPLRTKLISNRTKLTALELGRLAARYRNDLGYDSYESLAALDTHTVRDHCLRELNEEFLDYVGRPLVRGAWVADDAETSLAMFPQMDQNARGFYGMVRYRRLGSVAIGLSKRPEGRAPEGKGLLGVLLSHEYLEAHEHLTDEQVTEHAIERASAYYRDISGDVEETSCERWAESVPAMQLGRFRRMAEYHRNLDRGARVQFAGDFDRIPGMNGALPSGRDAAARIVTARHGAPAAHAL